MIDINRLLQRLCDANIDFVIVGGFAASIQVELFERSTRRCNDEMLLDAVLGRYLSASDPGRLSLPISLTHLATHYLAVAVHG